MSAIRLPSCVENCQIFYLGHRKHFRNMSAISRLHYKDIYFLERDKKSTAKLRCLTFRLRYLDIEIRIIYRFVFFRVVVCQLVCALQIVIVVILIVIII